MRGYNVLSLFGGIETGYAALRDAGVPIGEYWSSEIDKHAIKVTSHNYPEVVHLGDVKGVSVKDLPFIPDLLLAGFPCTDLSVAGKQGGFDNDRSGLFFEAVRILRECQAANPNVLFLFENVPMAKRYQWVINEMLGIRPWANNAALVSAQNRNRLWWSNIRTKKVGLFDEVHTDFPQPEDRGIFLKDILEKEVDEKYYLSTTRILSMIGFLGNKTQIDGEKSLCFTSRNDSSWKGEMITVKTSKNGIPKTNQEKADCFTAGGNSGGNHSDMDLIASQDTLRRLTPVEVCRLFTLPDSLFQGENGPIIAETNQYKCLGNGWVMKVVSHIFSFLPELT